MERSDNMQLKVKRAFEDIISDGFKFIKQNFKAIMLVYLMIGVPLLLIPAFIAKTMNLFDNFTLMSNPGGMSDIFDLFKMFSLIGLGTMLAYFVCNLSVYTAFLAYEDNGNQRLDFSTIIEYMKQYWVNYLVSSLVLMGLALVFYMVVVSMAFLGSGVFAFFIFAAIFVGIWAFTILSFFCFVRMREDLTVSESIQRCFTIVKDKWWSTFAVFIVSYFIAMMIMYILTMPISLLISFLGFSSMGANETLSGTAGLIMGTMFIFNMIFGLMGNIYFNTCKVLKYYDLIGEYDRNELFDEIDQIGNNRNSMFENEGDY